MKQRVFPALVPAPSRACRRIVQRFLVFASIVVIAHASSSDPALEPVHIPGGSVFDLPPRAEASRNSEGAFIDLKDGGVLFIYSRFDQSSDPVAGAEDSAKSRLAARVSRDRGVTWSADAVISTPEEETAMNVMAVSMLPMQNGDIGLFYSLRRSWTDTRAYLRRSSDDGRTWSTPVRIQSKAGYWVVEQDRAVRLSSGRIIVPTALHPERTTITPEEAVAVRMDASPWRSRKIDQRGETSFFLSDDDGRTWRESTTHLYLNSPYSRTGLQEPGVVELRPGVIWGWARTDLGRQYEFFSFDDGVTWTEPRPSRFTSPTTPMSIKRIPGSERFLAIWNPVPSYATRMPQDLPIGRGRTPLVGASGTGPTGEWTAPRIVDGVEGVDAAIHYCAIHFVSDGVLLGYSVGPTPSIKGWQGMMRLRKVPLDFFQR